MKKNYIDDLTKIDLKSQLLVKSPNSERNYRHMKLTTPARLGVGRAGTSYLTQTMLRFRADHASAQDSVWSYVSKEFLSEFNFIEVETRCKDKEDYITRPDLGRQLSSESHRLIDLEVPKKQKIQIMVGDGLSSAAIEANIRDMIPSLQNGLKTFNLSFDEESIIFVKHARVAVMDEIAEITQSDVICYFIGERPGLVSAESMSAYIAYRPTPGMPEARRNVVSNIHKGGTAVVEAGAYIAELLANMLKYKKSGLELNEVLNNG
ncbi:ethanolamine ammonia-lyase subunit EutC [Lactococcus kimchii]|uniref:ethanolamine ammonia-lyase subunit EutC n=1 Tax=Lactococcus sp. S-13 TaxID=2507158 RepID=UPI001023C9B2|nr:ethanolamine ammonia-lyase subunit EutC [Lactococcus sp. S-13]RZI49685.1 ethanolamine ammonia-lyase subunit EutC [Lactococcus sp. S-13]